MITLVLDPATFAEGTAGVEGDVYRHLFRAMRLAVGDAVRVVDGLGSARFAEVAAVDKKRGTLRLLGPAPAHEPAYRLELLVAAPKKERAAWLVEKATELGVSAIRLLASERAPRDFGAGSLERLTRVAVAAVEQCGRARVPAITGIHPWGALPSLLAELPDRWVLHPGAPAHWPSAQHPAGAILIGPEGGWSDAEVAQLTTLGAQPVGLGERLLRVETAAVLAAGRVLVG